MQRSELIYQVHIHIFLDCHVTAARVQQSFNLVNVLISNIFTVQTNRLTDRRTSLTPSRMRARGIINTCCGYQLNFVLRADTANRIHCN